MSRIHTWLQRGFGRLASSERRSIGLYLNDDGAFLAQTCRRNVGLPVVERWRQVLWKRDAADAGRLLREAWTSFGGQGDRLVVTFPHGRAIVRRLMLPASGPGDLVKMATLQAQRTLPWAAEEMDVQIQTAGPEDQGMVPVFMTAIRHDAVSDHLTLLRQAGLSPDRMILDSFAALWFVERQSGRNAAPLVGIALGNEAATVGLMEQGRWRAVRDVPMAAPPAWERLEQEIAKTAISAEPAPDWKQFPILIGGPSGVAASAAMAMRARAVRSVREIAMRDLVVWGPGVAACDEPGAWAAIGASLSDPQTDANLLPAGAQQRQRQAQRRREAGVTAVLSGLLLGLASVEIGLAFHRQAARLAAVTQDAHRVAEQARDLRRLQAQADRMQAQWSNGGSFVRIMAELNRLMPAGISIQSMTYERGLQLQIQGSSFSLQEALALVGLLQKSPLFSKVDLVSSTNRRVHDRDITDFQLSCPLRASAGHNAPGAEEVGA